MQLSLALLAGMAIASASPAVTETPAQKAYREAANGQVLFDKYPARALAAKEQGLVGFAVTLDRDGQPITCQVTHTSGYPLLDKETCDLVLFHMVFKPVKDAAGNDVRKSVHEGVVNWRLPDGPANAGAPVAISAKAAPERKICKRFLKTGTLASYERTCLTKAEWDRVTAESRDPWDEMQGRKGMTNGN